MELDKTGKMMNVTDSSSLIELLVKEGSRVREAADIAEVITECRQSSLLGLGRFRVPAKES